MVSQSRLLSRSCGSCFSLNTLFSEHPTRWHTLSSLPSIRRTGVLFEACFEELSWKGIIGHSHRKSVNEALFLYCEVIQHSSGPEPWFPSTHDNTLRGVTHQWSGATQGGQATMAKALALHVLRIRKPAMLRANKILHEEGTMGRKRGDKRCAPGCWILRWGRCGDVFITCAWTMNKDMPFCGFKESWSKLADSRRAT